jgi:two-component system, cell cycle response regulator DivK
MGTTVLIVDDDPKSMKLSRDVLSVFGYRTIAATNGEQAVQMAKEYRPDLILMDVQLPVLDGLSAVRLIRSDSATRDITIIAATAFAMRGDEERAMNAGCNGYLAKPIDIRLLLKTVEKHLSADKENRIVSTRSDKNETGQS